MLAIYIMQVFRTSYIVQIQLAILGIMAEECSSLVVTSHRLPQLPKSSEMIMTSHCFSKEPITTDSELVVSSLANKSPIQQTAFSVNKLYDQRHCNNDTHSDTNKM